MEFDSPINDNGSTHINIHVATNFTCKYTITESKSHTSPPDDNPDLKAYVAGLASHFEEYSAKWLSRPVNAITFKFSSCATRIALSTFFALPLVDITNKISPSFPNAKRGLAKTSS